MFRLLKLSETKQREHVHLGDVGHSAHGKYDVCILTIMLCFFFAFYLLAFYVLCNRFDISLFVLLFLFYSVLFYLLVI